MKSGSEDNFSSISPAEFFYRNKQMAGFGNPTQAVYSTVRELVENALDACEEKKVFPEIQVIIKSIDTNTLSITVSDNGTGLPHNQIPRAFGRILYGSKYDARQRRGTFGLGVTMAVLYGQITTDTPVIIHTQQENSPGVFITLTIDIEKNQPVVISEDTRKRKPPGTTVTIHLQGDLTRSRDRIIEYLTLSTIGSPHAKIKLEIDDSTSMAWGAFSDEYPASTISCKPHPRSADFEILRRLLRANPNLSIHQFLVESFQQVGDRTASKFLTFMGFDSEMKVTDLSRKLIVRLSNALQKYDEFNRPDARCLSAIGKAPMIDSIESLFSPDFVAYEFQNPSEWNGHPFILEGILAIGPDFRPVSIPTLYRFANRVPLLYDASEDILTKVLRQLRWSRYGLKSPRPVAIFINLCSTRVPYKAAGKQSIAAIPQLESAADLLFKALGRKLNSAVRMSERSSRYKQQIRKFTKYFKHIVQFSAELADSSSIPPVDSMIQDLFEVDVDE
ncbi:MAG: DNA topoisomerase VI subunit B [Candidatus Lokiarchaeota archaeon]|nr:DNA topoisomerase VI subunit B [Candidatus Lokiarchaeota archaeon]